MAEHDRLLTKMFSIQLLAFGFAALPFAFVLGLWMPHARGEGARLLAGGGALAAVFGVVCPYVILKRLLRRTLVGAPRGEPGARLTRILTLPGRGELALLASYAVGAVIGLGAAARLHPVRGLAVGVPCFVLLALLTAIPQRVAFERLLLPFAVEAFREAPTALPVRGGLLWPRLSWYLPYTFGVLVLAAVVTAGAVLGGTLARGSGAWPSPPLESRAPGALAFWGPLAVLGAYLLAVGLYVAHAVARRLRDGTVAVRAAITSLASGKPLLPAWVATDELGELALDAAAALEQLKSFSLSLRESARMLGDSAEELGRSTREQNEVLSLQAAALQQTQVTAQEIRQTSILAAQKAEGVLAQTERADELGRSGEAAIEQSLAGLQGIQQQVAEMATRIEALHERARQIAQITTTVKDLADQSNMLALNAAIEAVRSGEHGKGFGVVAREIRHLADESIQATNHVRDILQDILEAIRTTVQITQKGSEKVESSLAQVRAFGDNIRQLSSIFRDNALAVRQISAAVTQQNAGIGQIFQAVNDLTRMMDDTLQRLRATDDATTQVRTVAEKVSSFVGNYGWQELERSHPLPADSSTERGLPPPPKLTPSPAT